MCRGVRPFGVSLLMAGWDDDEGKPYLYQCDPSVSVRVRVCVCVYATAFIEGSLGFFSVYGWKLCTSIISISAFYPVRLFKKYFLYSVSLKSRAFYPVSFKSFCPVCLQSKAFHSVSLKYEAFAQYL